MRRVATKARRHEETRRFLAQRKEEKELAQRLFMIIYLVWDYVVFFGEKKREKELTHKFLYENSFTFFSAAIKSPAMI